MSQDKFEYERAELAQRRKHNPPCDRCSNSGWFVCRDVSCADWSFGACAEGFKPLDDGRRPIRNEHGRYYLGNDHSHACRCTLSGWDIWEKEREARRTGV